MGSAWSILPGCGLGRVLFLAPLCEEGGVKGSRKLGASLLVPLIQAKEPAAVRMLLRGC